MNKKNLEYYLSLNYRIKVELIEDNNDGKYWTAEYILLRGCKTEGATRVEAITNVRELFEEYINDRLEIDKNIPEPDFISLQKPDPEIWIELLPKKFDIITNDKTKETISDEKYSSESPLYQYSTP